MFNVTDTYWAVYTVSPSVEWREYQGCFGMNAEVGRAEGTVKINARVHAMQRIQRKKAKLSCSSVEL